MACHSGHGLHHQPRWVPIVLQKIVVIVVLAGHFAIEWSCDTSLQAAISYAHLPYQERINFDLAFCACVSGSKFSQGGSRFCRKICSGRNLFSGDSNFAWQTICLSVVSYENNACTSYKQCSNTLYISIYHCIVHPEPKWHQFERLFKDETLDTSLLLYTLIGRVSNVLCVSGDTCPSTPTPRPGRCIDLMSSSTKEGKLCYRGYEPTKAIWG